MLRRSLFAILLLATWTASAQQRQPLGRGVPDAVRITREVRHELLMLPYYSLFDFLAFKVNGGTVTLLGAVTQPSLKSDSEHVVKKIEGVEQVQNDIEVLPVSTFDDRIRLAEYRAIYGFTSLNRYALGSQPPIHIIVKNGHVTLVGEVDSEADKNTAGIQANGVPGVFSVTNNLTVSSSTLKWKRPSTKPR